MGWVYRPDQPLINLENVASIFTRKKEGYPEVYVVFALSGGGEVEWEVASYDEAEGVMYRLRMESGAQLIKVAG